MARNDYSFPRSVRLGRKKDFDRVFAQKCSAANDLLVVYAAANGLAFSRLGLSVSRKMGNAVVRNRLKRLLREAFRLGRPDWPAGYDFICIPRRPAPVTLAGYRAALAELFRSAVKRAGKRSGTPQAT